MTPPRILIDVPADVRRLERIPAGPLLLLSVWAMDDRRGLWVTQAGEGEDRVWPIRGVTVEDAQAWVAAGAPA